MLHTILKGVSEKMRYYDFLDPIMVKKTPFKKAKPLYKGKALLEGLNKPDY